MEKLEKANKYLFQENEGLSEEMQDITNEIQETLSQGFEEKEKEIATLAHQASLFKQQIETLNLGLQQKQLAVDE